MKRIVFLVIIALFFNNLLFSQDSKPKKITKEWVKTMKIKREAYLTRDEKYEIIPFDKELLEYIKEAEDVDKFEEEVNSLINDIIVTGKYYIEDNIVKGLDIALNKFQSKEYFLGLAFDVSNSEKIKYPAVLLKILEGYTKILDKHDKAIFTNLKLIYAEINSYINDQRKNNHREVVGAFMGFLYMYITLVDQGKIKDSQRKMVVEYCERLEMSKKSSEFQEKYPYGEKLKEAYFFYKEM